MSVKQRVLVRVDNWRFWMTIAYIVLAFMLFALYFVSARSSQALANTARDEAIHQSEIDAARKGAVQQCLASRPTLMRINGFVRSVQLLHEIIAENSLRLAKVTPKSDPSYQARLRNYQRIKSTLKPIELVHFPIPSKKECRARR